MPSLSLVRRTVALAIIAIAPVAAAAQTAGTPGAPGQNAPPTHHGMPGGGMMGPGHMMRVMFAVADTNGDGALSFEEVSAVHKRIFDAVDANKDGKVTPDELQAFMR